ncbi:hypothetical protein DFQ26_008076 [Actinomortierella ambigua]|nr:hypothetical protein DFQ26_008076 [Actinomortierella ambigua]
MPLMGYIINCGHLRSPFIPNFADLVDKQARTYEYMLNSLNNHVTTAKSTSHGDAKSANERGYSSSPHGGNRGDVGLPSAGVPLPIQLKKAEIAIVDLKVLVAHSGLPDRTKTLLVDRLERFHKRAKVAGRKLQTLQVRADSCIDNLVIRNTFVTRELDRLSDEQQRLERLNAERSFLRTWLSGPVEDTTIEASNRQLQTVYQSLMGDARDVVRNMILQAQDVLLDLNELESLLVSIHSISHHEQQNQNRGRDEILAILWTHLGANQVEMKSFNENLQLLQGVCDNREQATGRVQATLMKLNEFEDELGILREKMVDAILDPLLSGRSGGSGSDRISSEDESATDDGTPGQEPPLSHEMVARVLRSHVEQIDRTTARLRQRSLSAGSIDDHMAWKKAP